MLASEQRTEPLIGAIHHVGFSPRESDLLVAGLLIDDFTRHGLADAMCLSERTVANHLNSMRRQLGSRSIAQVLHDVFVDVAESTVLSQEVIDAQLAEIMPHTALAETDPQFSVSEMRAVRATVVYGGTQPAATALYSSQSTVRNHLYACYRKVAPLGVAPRIANLYLGLRRAGRWSHEADGS